MSLFIYLSPPTKIYDSDSLKTAKNFSDYREAFRLFDKNGDGSITTQELGNVMRSLGQYAMAEELREMLLEIDLDGESSLISAFNTSYN